MKPDRKEPTTDGEAALQRVLADILDALARGDRVDLPDWQARYPSFAADLAELFAARQELNGAFRSDATIVDARGRTPRPVPDTAAKPVSLGVFGDYELLEELGRGGMGRVYKARQRSLGRVVALKVIRFEDSGTLVDRLRFRTEAEAAARLDHSNIVPVYEVGEQDGQPYLALRYVEGGSLYQHVHRFRDDPSAAVALLAALARAVHHAHERGVLHRDLKPSNVLLEWPAGQTGAPVAHIADFGLARLVDQDSGLTRTGDLVGTPSYMAPEQASRRAASITTATDIYGLGAILYALLTGRPPFAGETVLDTLEQVKTCDPEPPSRLNPKVSRDLQTICLKCLRKEPAKRYASAWDLAEDLRRLQMQEPIAARAVSGGERLVLWTKRHKALAAVYALLGLVLLLGSVGGSVTWLWQRSEESRAQLMYEKSQSDQARRDAEEARQRLAELSYFYKVGLAYREWQDNEVARAGQLLEDCLPHRRGWEWHYVYRLCHAELFSLGHVNALAISPDGRRIASDEDGIISVRELATGKQIQTLKAQDGPVSGRVFNRDGCLLAGCGTGQTIKVWDTATGKELCSCQGHAGAIRGLSFHPDGRRLASASDDKTVRVWDARTGLQLAVFDHDPLDYQSVCFAPDGRLLAACSAGARHGGVKIWNTASGALVLSLQHSDNLYGVVFSPDGCRLAAGSTDKTVPVWDAATGRQLLTLRGHQGPIRAVAFSPDGTQLASCSADKTARHWNAVTGQELTCHRGHLAGVGIVTFSADGQLLTTAAGDKTVKIWRAAADDRAAVLRGHTNIVWDLKVSPDGRTIASASDDGTVRLWDVDTQRQRLAIPAHDSGVGALDISPNGQHLVTGGARDRLIKIWNAQTGSLVRTLAGHTAPAQVVVYSPNGSRIASVSASFSAQSGYTPGEINLWDAETGSLLHTLSASAPGFYRLAYSPDGKHLACGGKGVVAMLDADTGETLWSLQAHDDAVFGLAFSPDGQRLASASLDKSVKVWDSADGTPIFTFRGHTQGVTCVAFTPDGQRLATGGDDQTIRILAASSGDEALTLKGDLGPVHSLAFTPDGQRLVSGGWDHQLRIWDARPSAEPRP